MTTRMVAQKRFGMLAVEKQYITKEHVAEALQIQVDENMNKGIHRQIGAILFDMGRMDAGQVQMILGELNSTLKLAV